MLLIVEREHEKHGKYCEFATQMLRRWVNCHSPAEASGMRRTISARSLLPGVKLSVRDFVFCSDVPRQIVGFLMQMIIAYMWEEACVFERVVVRYIWEYVQLLKLLLYIVLEHSNYHGLSCFLYSYLKVIQQLTYFLIGTGCSLPISSQAEKRFARFCFVYVVHPWSQQEVLCHIWYWDCVCS